MVPVRKAVPSALSSAVWLVPESLTKPSIAIRFTQPIALIPAVRHILETLRIRVETLIRAAIPPTRPTDTLTGSWSVIIPFTMILHTVPGTRAPSFRSRHMRGQFQPRQCTHNPQPHGMFIRNLHRPTQRGPIRATNPLHNM